MWTIPARRSSHVFIAKAHTIRLLTPRCVPATRRRHGADSGIVTTPLARPGKKGRGSAETVTIFTNFGEAVCALCFKLLINRENHLRFKKDTINLSGLQTAEAGRVVRILGHLRRKKAAERFASAACDSVFAPVQTAFGSNFNDTPLMQCTSLLSTIRMWPKWLPQRRQCASIMVRSMPPVIE